MQQASAPPLLIAQYLDYARFEKRLAERTLVLYTLDLLKLSTQAEAAGVALTDVAHHHIRRWVVQMHSQGRSGRGIALILSGWRGFYVWLGRQGLVPSNPVKDVRAPKAAKPLPKALGLDEAMGFADFENEADNPWLEARDAAIVELLYGGGLRVGELTGLDAQPGKSAKGWVDLAAGEAHVLGKGSKRRIVPIGRTAVAALEKWLEMRQDLCAGGQGADISAAMFLGRYGTRLTATSVWQRLRRRSRLAGTATPVHPHMLRHSFASHVLQSSGDLRAVQELLGHANITTTQVYTRLDFQHLAATYDKAHPRAKLKAP
ncbi:MAG: tyrosine-type recombinase/integrase [Ferruginibacter sp.]|nr:tyrosine-type recombinase/integrase [Rhodoferax sp.]